MYGVNGQLLHIDLTTGVSTTHPIPDAVFTAFIGGIGFASYLAYQWCPAGVDPLSPDNALIFTTSPFNGTSITTSSKIAVATRSPQTGMIGDSLSSSYLALSLKRTGYDALIITGAAAEASLLVIDNDQVTIRSARHLIGLDPANCSDAVRLELGTGFRVAAIGVAGERMVRFAAISNDGRLAGRTGTGAVMGSKNLKAIAIHGNRPTSVADAAALSQAAKALARRSVGPETAKYREIGTAANLAFFNRLNILPTHNFQAGSFDGAESISGETFFLEHRTDKNACAACTVGCEHHYRTTDGGPESSVRLEYESLFALGSLCGIDDPNTILRAAALCDNLGIDSISTGGTIAWAMECAERGINLGVPAYELPRFGNSNSMIRTIQAIGDRTGIGDLLAEGSRRAAEIVGQGTDAWAMHVKGLEMPGYDPRKLRTMALGLAVATRGACHNRSSAYDVDLSDRLDRGAEDRLRAEAAAAAEDQASLLDSLTVCKFLRHCFDDIYAETAHLYSLVTGCPTSADDLRIAAARVTTIKRLFNIKHGWTRADDTLPPRLLDGDSAMTRDQLNALIETYYAVRRWNVDGSVPDAYLEESGLAPLTLTHNLPG